MVYGIWYMVNFEFMVESWKIDLCVIFIYVFFNWPTDGKGNAFIRKGKVGDWRNYFDEKMNAEWDPWIEEQLKGSDFKMEFDL